MKLSFHSFILSCLPLFPSYLPLFSSRSLCMYDMLMTCININDKLKDIKTLDAERNELIAFNSITN